MKNKKSFVEKNILTLLREIEDHRRGQGQRHSLHTVLLITILSIMSGAKSERAIARFAKNNKKELVKLLGIKRKEVPSKSVISGVIQNIDFKKLERIFYKWSIQYIHIEKGEWISIDGKSIRGTYKYPDTGLQDFISLVTIFLSKKKQVLSVGKLNVKKENEIPTVRQLIEMLDLHDVTFTLDALHCQSKTMKTIVDTKNNYIIGVKDNQKYLLKQIKKTAKTRK